MYVSDLFVPLQYTHSSERDKNLENSSVTDEAIKIIFY
jgi:hypothetical protein